MRGHGSKNHMMYETWLKELEEICQVNVVDLFHIALRCLTKGPWTGLLNKI